MIIQKLILHNWKNFQNVEVSLSERCFIIGANAAGKSNLIDALRFLRDIAKWKIQCTLPPKTKRFCPLVLK